MSESEGDDERADSVRASQKPEQMSDVSAYATPLCAACAFGDVDAVLALLADVDEEDDDGWVAHRTDDGGVGSIDASLPLHLAAQGGHARVVQLLLDRGVDVDCIAKSNGNTALIATAASGDHVQVVDLLLDRGAAIDRQNVQESTALHVAALRGGVATVQLLLDRLASVNIADEKGNTPLCIAAKHGFVEIVQLLLAGGAAVDATNRDGATPLYSAARHGHLEVVEILIDCGASIDAKRPKGWTSLSIASYFGHTDVVSILLNRGVDVDQADVSGATPLYIASDQGHAEIVQMLLDQRASPDIQTSDGFTPLYVASSKQHTTTIQILLEGGASVDIPSSRSWTPLHAACFFGHVDAASALLGNSASIDEVDCDGDTALSKACSQGHFETVQLLLGNEAAVDVSNSMGRSPLFCAARNGHLEIVQALIDRETDVDVADEVGATPLHAASRNGHSSVVTALLDRNACVDAADMNGMTPLFDASSKGFADIVRILLDRDASMDVTSSDGDSPLGVASYRGHFDVVIALLDHGAEVDFVNSNGRTALLAASEKGRFEVVEELLRRGADASIPDVDGDTPLSAASAYGHTAVVILLVDGGAPVASANQSQCTALHRASASGHLSVIRVLLEQGADVNSADSSGDTALHYASQHNYVDIVALLLEENADADLKSSNGVTPLLLACRAGHLEVAMMLLDRVSTVYDSDVKGNTPLIVAASEGHKDIVKILIENGASLELPNSEQQTPLLAAASCGHFSVLRVLLAAGASVDVRDAEGETLLTCAARWGLIGVAGMLIEAGWHPFASVAGIETPILSTTLQTLVQYGSEMHEFEGVWDSVAIRLVDIYAFLQQEGAEVIPLNIGRRFVRMFVRFIGLKVVCEDASIVVRFVASYKIVSSIQDFHAEIDHLLRRLDDGNWSEPTHAEWFSRLHNEQSAIMEAFDAEVQDENLLLSELEDDTDQIEALCLLEYEKREQSDIYTQGQLDLLKLFLEKIVELVGDAETVPEWFIPSHELDVGSESSVYEESKQIHRGKWLNSNVLIHQCDTLHTNFVEACNVWFQLSHPNVISLFGAYHLRAPYLVVCENASSTSLMDFLAAGENQRCIWQKMYEVAFGLSYLHERTIVLGKLRCDDIWIGKDGLAMIPGSSLEGGEVDSASDEDTLQWLPPEIMRGEDPSFASDVYALGMCIVEAVAGKSPWPDWTEYTVYSDAQVGFLPARPDGMNRHQWYLIQTMCGFEPSERVTMTYVTEHLKFFAIQEGQTLEAPISATLSGGISCNLRDYIMPELSSSIEITLENLQSRCSMASDACDVALHVHARLANIYELLQEMHKLPRDIEVSKFCDVLVMFYTFLRAAVSETSLIQRAKSRKVSLKGNVLHREVDGLLDLLQAADIDPVHSWTPETAANAVTRLEVLDEAPEIEEEPDENRAVKLLHFKAAHLNRRYDVIDVDALNHLIAEEGYRPPWFIPIYELRYQREDSVGMGAFGAVYRGMWLGTSVVVKFMGYEDDTDRENLEMFFHELRIWYPLNHPHVVRLYGACHIGKRFFVCEYAANGTLYDFLQRDQNRDRTWKMLYELALGLQYLHKENIIHNDLKCDNFLVGTDGKAKISDFGLSCIPNSAEVTIDPKQQGAQQWKSPEYLRGDRLTLASDIYSFGMCILEAVTGTSPWGRMLDVFVRMKVRKGFLPPRPESVTDEQFNLVEMMCASDPAHRLQIASVVERLHEFSRERKHRPARSKFRRFKSYASF